MQIPEKYLIRRISQVSGKMNEMEMMLTPDQFKAILAWNKGEGPVIQVALSFLNAEEREFLITGQSREEQNYIFGDGEDE